MAIEGSIGELFVDIGANLTPLEDAIARAVTMAEAGGEKIEKALLKGGGTAAPPTDVASPGTTRNRRGQTVPADTASKSSINADLKIKDVDVVKAVQAALDGHEFQLLINKKNLRDQVIEALKGIPLDFAAGSVHPQQAAHGVQSISEAVREWPAEVKKAFTPAVKSMTDAFDEALSDAFKSAGRTLPGAGGTSSIDKLARAVQALGSNFDDLIPAKPTGAARKKALAGLGELGIKGDHADALLASGSQLRQQSAMTGALTQVRDVLAKQPTPQSGPASHSTTVPPVVQQAIASNVVEQLVSAAGAGKSNLAPVRAVSLGTGLQAVRRESVEAGIGQPTFTETLGRAVAKALGLENANFDKKGRPRSSVQDPRGSGVRTGYDPADDIRALEQLGINRANVRRNVDYSKLQGEAGGLPIDLRGIGVQAGRGRLAGYYRNPKTAEYGRLEAIGVEGTLERAESEARVRDLTEGRAVRSLPGVEGRVKPISPADLIKDYVQEYFGDPGVEFLNQPEVQAELKKLISFGSRIQPSGAVPNRSGRAGKGFAHVAAGDASGIGPGIAEFEANVVGVSPEVRGRNAALSNKENRDRIAADLAAQLPDLTRKRIDAREIPDFTHAFSAIPGEAAAGGYIGLRAKGFARRRAAEITKLLTKGAGDATPDEIRRILGKPDLSDEGAEQLRTPSPHMNTKLRNEIRGTGTNIVSGIEFGPARAFLNQQGTSSLGRSTEDRGPFGGLPGSFAKDDVDALDYGSGGNPAGSYRHRTPTALEQRLRLLEDHDEVAIPKTKRKGKIASGEIPTLRARLGRQSIPLREPIATIESQVGEAAAADVAAQFGAQPTSSASGLGKYDFKYGQKSSSGSLVTDKKVQAAFSARKKELTERASAPVAEQLAQAEKEKEQLLKVASAARRLIASGPQDVNEARASIGKLNPKSRIRNEALELLQLRTPGHIDDVAFSEGKGRSPGSGDQARLAHAKTALSAAPHPEEARNPSFDEVNALLRGGAGGSGGGGRETAAGAGGAGGGDEGGDRPRVSGNGAIDVRVVNWPEGFGGAGGGAGGGKSPITYESAAHGADFDFKFGRSSIRRQTSAGAQNAFGADVERLRTQLGLSDEQIKKIAKSQGLETAVTAFFPEDEASGGGGGFGGGGFGGRSRLAQNKRRAVIGLPPVEAKDDAFFELQDEGDSFRSSIAQEVRTAQRFETRRGFTASTTDIITNLIGIAIPFIGKQQKAISRFAREGAQESHLRDIQVPLAREAAISGEELQVAQAAHEKAVQDFEAAKAAKATAKERTPLKARVSETTNTLKGTTEAHSENTRKLVEVNKQLDFQSVRTEKARDDLPGGAGKLAAFGAGFTAAAGAVAVGQLVATLATTVMQDIAAAIGPAIDRASGSPGVTQAITKAIATGGAAGTFAAATSQIAAQAGTTSSGLGGLTQRAQALSGNANLIAQFDLIRGQNNVERSNRGLPPGVDSSISKATGGIFDSGIGITGIGDFQLSTQQIIAQGLDKLPSVAERSVRRSQTGTENFPNFGETNAGAGSFGQTDSQISENTKNFADRLELGTEFLDKFNKEVSDGGSTFKLAFADKVGASADDVDKFAKSLKDANLPELAATVREKGLIATGAEPTGLSAQIALAAAQKAAAGYSPQGLIDANEPARRAQEGLRIQKINLARDQVIPGQFGISNATSPLASPEQLKGLLPGQDTSALEKTYAAVNADIEGAKKGAKDFVNTNLPGYGADFAKSLEAAVGYAKQINDAQLGVQIQQAKLSADKYAYSITIANRSLQDAKGLTGEIKDANKDNLGVLERQAFLLGREGQALSLELSQLQINFQKAVSGFVSPGATPEERAARIKEAEKEAAIAQRKLDIEKKQFTLASLTFNLTSKRGVTDAKAALSFLSRDYQLSLDSAAATLEIQGVQKLLDKEKAFADLYFTETVSKVTDVYAYEASLVATTGAHLAEVSGLVLKAFADSYNEMILKINGTVINFGGGGGGGNETIGQREKRFQEDINGNGVIGAATGFLGTTSGMSNFTVGEAGNETVAVLRNPRSMIMPTGGGGGGDSPTIIINVSGNKFSNEEDERRLVTTLTAEIERKMGRNAALYGLRRPV